MQTHDELYNKFNEKITFILIKLVCNYTFQTGLLPTTRYHTNRSKLKRACFHNICDLLTKQRAKLEIANQINDDGKKIDE